MSEKAPRPDDERQSQHTGQTTTDDGGVSRRKLMAASAAGWATVSLAGCSDSGGDDGDGGTTDGETTDDVTVTTQTTTTAGGDTPTTTEEDGGGGGGEGTTECTQSGVFAPGMDVGFLVDVYDDFTGDKLDDEALSTVVLSFPHADLDPVELSPSGPHEEHVRDKWGGKVSFPVDADPGTYKYEISVARDPDAEPEPVVTDEVTLADISL